MNFPLPPRLVSLFILRCGSALFLLQWPASGAAVLLDSFSDGSFSGTAGRGVVSFVSGEIADLKSINYVGAGLTSFVQVAETGTLTLRAFNRAPLPETIPYHFSMYYSNDLGALELLGLNGAVIKVASITGLGDIRTLINSSLTSEYIPIGSSGDLMVPFPVFPEEYGSRVRLTFEILVRSENFRLTMEEISLIPEPSAGMLVAPSLAVCLLRRRARSGLGCCPISRRRNH